MPELFVEIDLRWQSNKGFVLSRINFKRQFLYGFPTQNLVKHAGKSGKLFILSKQLITGCARVANYIKVGYC